MGAENETLEQYFAKFRKNIIGIEQHFSSPYGEQKVIYADWTASGRLYRPIEEKIINDFGPFVANTHTETTITGSAMTMAYHAAKKIIKNHVHADANDIIITYGTGMTGVAAQLCGDKKAVEELGYRYFAGNVLLRMHMGRIVAAIVPAVVFGAVHANLDFLPPGEPWWYRIIPITLVGVLWGFAFVKWDALTVVLSHWTCDLFLFNQPRLASGDVLILLSALACIAVPLLPAAVNLGLRGWSSLRHKPGEPWSDESDFDGADPAMDVDSAFDFVQADERASPDDSSEEPPDEHPDDPHGKR